jgi:hypothetical protein
MVLPLSSVRAAPERTFLALKLPREMKGRGNYHMRCVRSAAGIGTA